ncbi:LysM domain-containing protein [Kribbella sp. NPDC051770]|uniref:LysM peptidoglycan-binding domain-containing protein n=1 Tax=Kribbella sp. NPDC051770 TaxID=3155413 RepID=UPI00341E6CEE
MIRGLKALIALGALAGLGFALRWVTAGAMSAASTRDLISMAFVTVAAVAWTAYGWLLLAVLATVLEQVPGAVGRVGAAVGGRITSQGSRTLLRSALGVAAVTPLTIGVAHASPAHPGQQPVSSGAAWRATEPASTVAVGETGDWRAVERASTVRLGETVRTSEPAGSLGAEPAGSDTREPRVRVPDRPTDGAPVRYTDLASGRHVVVRGESLWSIAAAELGAGASDEAIAARWPEWYAANRAVIGADPDVLRPGQVLQTPASFDRSVSQNPQEK